MLFVVYYLILLITIKLLPKPNLSTNYDMHLSTVSPLANLRCAPLATGREKSFVANEKNGSKRNGKVGSVSSSKTKGRAIILLHLTYFNQKPRDWVWDLENNHIRPGILIGLLS